LSALLLNSCYKNSKFRGIDRRDPGLRGQIFFAVFFAKINLSPVFEALTLPCFVELMGTLHFAHPTSTFIKAEP